MLLRAHAEVLSKEDVVSGVIEEIITINQVYELMPFIGTNGKAYVYKRELTLPAAIFHSDNEDVEESTSQFQEIMTKLRILVGDVQVDNFLRETMSDIEDQVALQLQAKAKAMGRTFMGAMVSGDSLVNPKEFDGIKVLTTAGQTIPVGPNGGALSLSLLDQLIDTVPNKPDFLMMRSGTRRAYLAALRTAGGGTNSAMLQMPNGGAPVLSHAGVPILVNDFLPSNETLGAGVNLTSIYAVRANEVDGVHGLYGGSSAGLRLENLGTMEKRDAQKFRLKWYCGMAVKSTRSIARLSGVTNV